jgi:hypothetical protein
MDAIRNRFQFVFHAVGRKRLHRGVVQVFRVRFDRDGDTVDAFQMQNDILYGWF